jgi:hypothetical protein
MQHAFACVYQREPSFVFEFEMLNEVNSSSNVS